MQETQETEVWSLGWEDPLEEGTATHFSILAGESQDRGAWQATVHRVAKSRTWLKRLHMHALQRSGWESLFFFLLICLQTWSPLFSSTPIPSLIRPCLSTFSHVRPPKLGSCTDMCRISARLNPFCHIFRNKTISNLWFLFSTRAWIIYPLILNI